MKIFTARIFLAISVFLIAFSSTRTADGRPVHLRPDHESPVIGRPADGDPVILSDDQSLLTDELRLEGWQAITFLKNFAGFVQLSDLTKDLEVRTGALVYLEPRRESGLVLTEAGRHDLFEVSTLTGQWVSVTFRKPLTGFLGPFPETTVLSQPSFVEEWTVVGPEDSPAAVQWIEEPPPPPPTPAATPTPAPPPPAPLPAVREKPAAVTAAARLPRDEMLRSFEGRLARSRSWIAQPPPYPFQLVDWNGRRIAFLDLSKLLITEPLDKNLGRALIIYGKAEPIPERRDFVIRAEHMRAIQP